MSNVELNNDEIDIDHNLDNHDDSSHEELVDPRVQVR